MSETIFLEPGEQWSLTLAAEDPDNDLAEVQMTFSDSAEDWLDWNQSTLTVETGNLDLQTLGTFTITVQLSDLEGKTSAYPIVIEVACGSNNISPLCAPEPTVEDTTTAAITTTTDVSTTALLSPQAATAAILEEFLDYEVKEVVSLEELVEPIDPDLVEDDDFEDVPNVYSAEQAAEFVETIEAAASIAPEDIQFDEELIPTGGVVDISEEALAELSEDEVAKIQATNEYA